MTWNNKVVWSRGLFLRPQHFQQQDRHQQSLIAGYSAGVRSYNWGILELKIDESLLPMGKFAITHLRGRLPDGTPVNIPEDDDAPQPLNIPENTLGVTVFLTLPVKRREAVEVADADSPESLARYQPYECEVRDNNAGSGGTTPVQVGKLRLRLMLETESLGPYACLGLARIVERRADKQVVLDSEFIPPALDCHAVPRLTGLLRELEGLMRHRSEALAHRVSDSGRGGTAEVADFMLLQAVNRYTPLLAHLNASKGLHPEAFYQLALQMAGEMATFSAKTRLPAEFPVYRHDDLQNSFAPVVTELRRSMGTVLEQAAIPLALEAHRYGIHTSTITDHNLIGKAFFVLAVNANISTEELRTRFPLQVKVGPVEKIREMVNLSLPGISLRPLPVAPRQIPYHAGFTYFELDRASEFWKVMPTSGGFAFHVGGEFPGLELEFWAIKE